MDIFLHCQSQPVTENATAVKFSCFQGGYDGLVGQLEATKLSPFTNRWAQVHDFTPVPDTDNWTLFPSEVLCKVYALHIVKWAAILFVLERVAS